MILYLDTSALVKLFVSEPSSDLVHAAVQQATFRGCHIIGYAEAAAALARYGRALGLAISRIEEATSDLTRSWLEGIDVIEASWPLIYRAGELAARYRLRGYDSVHLAAAEAVWLRSSSSPDFHFAVFDDQLANAAEALGVRVLAGS